MSRPQAAAILLVLAALAGPVQAESGHGAPAAAHGAPKPAGEKAPGTVRSTLPLDPLSNIEGSLESWSVSKNDDGCYLMSPFRRATSRLAIGRHAKFGLGVFAVRLALALAGEGAVEPASIRVGTQEMSRPARTIGASVLLVAVDEADIAAALEELHGSGTLWIHMRQSWIAHNGRDVDAAIAAFKQECGLAAPG